MNPKITIKPCVHGPLKTLRVLPALDFIAKASLGHSARPSTTMATDNMHSKEEKRRKNKQATTGCHKKTQTYFLGAFGNHFTCPLDLT